MNEAEFMARAEFLRRFRILAQKYGWTGDFVEVQNFFDFCCSELEFPREELKPE
jgi:hypothetical protein